MSIYLGEIAAIFTALCWTFTAVFFAQAARQVGSVVVNRVRLLLAVLLLSFTNWLMFSTWIPQNAGVERWIWLSISGVIGLAIADAFLFQSYLWIGPRLGMLLMSMAPVVATLLAWIFLNETLGSTQVLGILLAVGGTAWVVFARGSDGKKPTADPNYVWGIMFGIGAATGQAVGLITAKKGLSGDFPALSGNLIRMIAAAAVMWGYAVARGKAGTTLQRAFGSRSAGLNLLGGSFFGPFVGVWLSLVAIQLTQIGIASTLMALTPIFLIPVGYFIFKEEITWAVVVGTVIAMIGVTILFLT